jgi:hypothetical protein
VLADDRHTLAPPQRFLLTPAPDELVAPSFSPITDASLHLPPICDTLTSEGSRASNAVPLEKNSKRQFRRVGSR